MKNYPKVKNPRLIGKYPTLVFGGGGYVWDEVLEYRVWCHPVNDSPDRENGDDYYKVFATFVKAFDFFQKNDGAEMPIALILQKEYIDEPEEGKYVHIKKERITEWPVEFLDRPKRNENTIPDFLSPNAPPNRLDILRGKLKTNNQS